MARAKNPAFVVRRLLLGLKGVVSGGPEPLSKAVLLSYHKSLLVLVRSLG